MSDRVVVMREGQVSGVLEGGAIDEARSCRSPPIGRGVRRPVMATSRLRPKDMRACDAG